MPAPGVGRAVALGGAAGVVCGSLAMGLVSAGAVRALAGPDGGMGSASALLASALPVAVVNVLGSFLLGLLWARSRRAGPAWRPQLVAGLGTGFLGSFTTISSATAAVVLQRLDQDIVALAAWSGVGGFLSHAASLSVPALAVLTALAVISTAAAVLGLRLGGAPRGERGPHGGPRARGERGPLAPTDGEAA